MLLIVLVGVLVFVLQRWLAAAAEDADALVVSVGARILAGCSFLLWLGVIIFGRQIAYTLARPGT